MSDAKQYGIYCLYISTGPAAMRAVMSGGTANPDKTESYKNPIHWAAQKPLNRMPEITDNLFGRYGSPPLAVSRRTEEVRALAA